VRLLTFDRLKWASFTHSTIYLCLLIAWAIPGLHQLEFVLGLAHGLGWIAMCLLSIVAVQRRVIPLYLAVAVSIIGAVGPFVGSAAFVYEGRRRPGSWSPRGPRYSQDSHGS
jgi:hypothetical protein